MKSPRFLALGQAILLALAVLTPARVYSESRGEVLLIGASGACGSGFFVSPSLIATNAHVARSVCPLQNCGGLKLLQSKAIDTNPTEELHYKYASLEKVFGGIDAALIRIQDLESKTSSFVFLPRGALNSDSELEFYGFPACKELRQVKGKTVSTDPIRYKTTLLGKHGASGSVVLHNNAVAGLVVQSDSFIDAIMSVIYGSDFELRIVRGDLLKQLLFDNDSNYCEIQASWLLSFYEGTVRNSSGLNRLRNSFDFISLVDSLRLSCIENQGLGHATAAFGSFLDFIGSLPKSNSDKETLTTLLITAVNIELNGPYSGLLQLAHPDLIAQTFLRATGDKEGAALIKGWVEQSLKDNWLGTERALIVYVLLALPALLFIAAIWGVLSTLCFKKTGGSFFKKLLVVSLLSLLIWPISMPLFLILKRKN